MTAFGDLAHSIRSWRGWRNPAQLRAEIEKEIRFHLEERADALEADGMSREAARAQARVLFGNVDRLTLDCLTEQLGKRALVQRVQWVLIGGLLIALALMSRSYAVESARQRDLAQQLRAEAELSLMRAQEIQARTEEASPSHR